MEDPNNAYSRAYYHLQALDITPLIQYSTPHFPQSAVLAYSADSTSFQPQASSLDIPSVPQLQLTNSTCCWYFRQHYTLVFQTVSNPFPCAPTLTPAPCGLNAGR